MPLINSYFDYGDFEKIPLGKDDPRLKKGIELDSVGVIKQYIDDRYFLEVDISKRKKVNVYLQKSLAQMQDDYLQLGQQSQMKFVEIENFIPYDSPYRPQDSFIAAVFFRYDP